MGELVIYEDGSLLVLNKPSGITVNRSDTTSHETTLQDIVEKHLKISYPTVAGATKEGEYPSIEEVFKQRSGIAHRLDKETSGIILVAKNPKVFELLQKAFKDRAVQKQYIALAHGRIVPNEGEINVPVGRLKYNRMKFGVVAGGREATTRYRVDGYYLHKKNNEILSLVLLYPHTGRTHQIRVHLQHLHHPIVSDALYAGRKTAIQDRKALQRLFLHASEITFVHPVTQREMSFSASLPDDLLAFLHSLEIVR